MDNLPFFQEENKDLLYNLCKDEIYKEKQYNIDESKKYYKNEHYPVLDFWVCRMILRV